MEFNVKHDLHCHTGLSYCSCDETMTPQSLLDFAENAGYDLFAVTNHFWDIAAGKPTDGCPGDPDEPAFYQGQDFAHISQELPLPQGEHVRMLFGCEADYSWDGRLGLTEETIDAFDMIVISMNHFHMEFVRGATVKDFETTQEYFFQRMTQLLQYDLPWHRVGLGHLNCSYMFPFNDSNEGLRRLDEGRLRKMFAKCARLGCGIELNAGNFLKDWSKDPEAQLRIFRFAKDEGCKFYCGSDNHTWNNPVLPKAAPLLREVADALGLHEEDRFIPVRD